MKTKALRKHAPIQKRSKAYVDTKMPRLLLENKGKPEVDLSCTVFRFIDKLYRSEGIL